MTGNPPRVLVLGGTGKTGRGADPAVASRRGPVRFDWTDRSTWRPALDGVEAAYVVDSQAPDAPEEIRGLAEEARDVLSWWAILGSNQ